MTDKQRTKLLREELKKFFPQYNNGMFNQSNKRTGEPESNLTK